MTMRSVAGMKPESTLSMVVLPAPVPPEMTTLSRPITIALNTSATGCVNVPYFNRSGTPKRSTANRRIESIGPSMARGGMMAFTRDPSASRASTMGEDSSMRRPTAETMRSMMFMRCASL